MYLYITHEAPDVEFCNHVEYDIFISSVKTYHNGVKREKCFLVIAAKMVSVSHRRAERQRNVQFKTIPRL